MESRESSYRLEAVREGVRCEDRRSEDARLELARTLDPETLPSHADDRTATCKRFLQNIGADQTPPTTPSDEITATYHSSHLKNLPKRPQSYHNGQLRLPIPTDRQPTAFIRSTEQPQLLPILILCATRLRPEHAIPSIRQWRTGTGIWTARLRRRSFQLWLWRLPRRARSEWTDGHGTGRFEDRLVGCFWNRGI